jgi:ABC-type transport system involved in multi-copper enzyme maturation permease subunit
VSVPIFDQTYQRWQGVPHLRSPALVLARAQLRVLFGRWAVRLVLLASLLATLVLGTMIYFESHTASFGPLRNLSEGITVNAAAFRFFMLKQRLLHLLLCLIAADAIALDRRHRALQIYLARPVRVRDYVLARSLAVVVPLALTTWIPGLFLVLLKTAIRAEVSWLAPEPWLPASILGYGALLAVPLALLTLAVSSLSSSPRQASALLFAVLALSGACGQLLSSLTRSDAWLLLSVNANLDQVGHWVFASPAPHDLAPGWSMLALGVLAAASVYVLHRRIRPLEIVGGNA